MELLRTRLCEEYMVRRTFSGHVATARASNLGFESQGKIAGLLADEGDLVEIGEELARQDTRKLDAQRRRVAAELAQAQAALTEARNGERKQTIRAAKFRVTELEAELKPAESELQRIRKARAQQSVTLSELDAALAARDGVRARLEIARSRLSRLREGARREQIAVRAAMVDALTASLEEIDAQLEDAVLVAPFAGTIARRFVDDGEVVAAGRAIFRLVETSRLEARVGLSPRAATPLRIGQTVDVRLGNAKGTATLTALLPELDPQTRTRAAVFSLDAGIASQAVAGEVIEVVVPQVVRERGCWLPTSALVRSVRGLWSCFAAVPLKGAAGTGRGTSLYRIERRDLETLFVEGDRVFVRGTIRNDDEIVAKGTHRVVSDQIVQRRKRSSPARATGHLPDKAAP
ncbi:MAG: efflux RND transporter periplasmic adaptor subunit [Planctomycetaceae bacterium]